MSDELPECEIAARCRRRAVDQCRRCVERLPPKRADAAKAPAAVETDQNR